MSARKVLGWVAAATAVAGVATGTAAWLSARDLRQKVSPGSSDQTIEQTNRSIDTRNTVMTVSLIAGGGAAAAALWLLWPRTTHHAALDVRPGFAGLSLSGQF